MNQNISGIGERIKQLRKSEQVKLTLETFGKKIGMGKSAISDLETGRRFPTDQTIKLICREFNVNQEWLLTGKGEMFNEVPPDTISRLVEQFGFGDLETKILTEYMKLRPKDKEKVLEYIRVFMLGQQADSQEDEIENEVEDYRRQLELEKRQEEQSEVSPGEEGNTEMA